MLTMVATLSLVLLLLVFPFTLGTYDLSEAQLTNGLLLGDLEKATLDDTRVVLTNNTWTPFVFTNAGSWGRPLFQAPFIPGNNYLALDFADAFCAGDQFTMYTTNTILNFSDPGSVPVGTPSCNNYTLDPASARLNSQFSSGGRSFTGFAVTINVTMVATVSPFSAGRAYVRALYKPS